MMYFANRISNIRHICSELHLLTTINTKNIFNDLDLETEGVF